MPFEESLDRQEILDAPRLIAHQPDQHMSIQDQRGIELFLGGAVATPGLEPIKELYLVHVESTRSVLRWQARQVVDRIELGSLGQCTDHHLSNLSYLPPREAMNICQLLSRSGALYGRLDHGIVVHDPERRNIALPSQIIAQGEELTERTARDR